MNRYIFFDPPCLPPGLHVIGIPVPSSFVWVGITASDYQATIAHPDLARQLIAYARKGHCQLVGHSYGVAKLRHGRTACHYQV